MPTPLPNAGAIEELTNGGESQFRRDGDRACLGERLDPLKKELRALLEKSAGKEARNRRQRTFAGVLLQRRPALRSIANVPGVERPCSNIGLREYAR